jgi:lipoyl synthase
VCSDLVTRSIRVSLGTASVLGLLPVAFDCPPTTAYLLVGDRCACDCAFCAQALTSASREDGLSRVSWPQFDETAALDSIVRGHAQGRISRACLQVTAGPRALAESARLVSALNRQSDLPVCAAVLPRTLEEVEYLLAAGADVVGFGLDGATPTVYERVKTPGCEPGAGQAVWRHQLALVETAAQRHPQRIGVHLIVGLGETERDLVELIQELVDADAIVALFAFTPVRGTAMGKVPPPPLESYRRCQAALHFIATKLSRLERFTFDSAGSLVGFGLTSVEMRQALSGGAAFRTSGCPACNRPYYNERPRGVMYNYPRPLAPAELEAALAHLRL